MTPEQILAIRPEVLTQQQREFHFENGYILLEKLLPDDWVARLRKATDEMVDKSRSIIGCLKPEDATAIDMRNVDYLEGPAGSVTIHNCRMGQGSVEDRR